MENTTNTDWSKIIINDGWDRRPLNVYNDNTTYTKVTCKDGTTKNQPSSPNAKYSDVCMNNGGVDNQKTNDDAKKLIADAIAKSNEDALAQAQSKSPTKSGVPIFKKLAGAYNQNLIIAVVLIGGYFAYKKFKK